MKPNHDVFQEVKGTLKMKTPSQKLVTKFLYMETLGAAIKVIEGS